MFRDVENIDDETRCSMTQAFDAVCDKLKLDEGDPLREKLANEIIALVSIGERGPARFWHWISRQSIQKMARRCPGGLHLRN